MPSAQYDTRKRNSGALVIEHNCQVCGAVKGKKCWDMRYAYGTMINPVPHQERGILPVDEPPGVVDTAKWDSVRMSPEHKGKGVLIPISVTVLRQLAEGRTYRQISTTMSLSMSVIRKISDDILWRMGAFNITHAVHLAYKKGIFRVDDSDFPSCRWCTGPIMGRDIRAIFCSNECQWASSRADIKKRRTNKHAYQVVPQDLPQA
jgi:DNA-binding CsgD family transcriptional regulator